MTYDFNVLEEMKRLSRQVEVEQRERSRRLEELTAVVKSGNREIIERYLLTHPGPQVWTDAAHLEMGGKITIKHIGDRLVYHARLGV
jgi:hypothetical protein